MRLTHFTPPFHQFMLRQRKSLAKYLLARYLLCQDRAQWSIWGFTNNEFGRRIREFWSPVYTCYKFRRSRNYFQENHHLHDVLFVSSCQTKAVVMHKTPCTACIFRGLLPAKSQLCCFVKVKAALKRLSLKALSVSQVLIKVYVNVMLHNPTASSLQRGEYEAH